VTERVLARFLAQEESKMARDRFQGLGRIGGGVDFLSRDVYVNRYHCKIMKNAMRLMWPCRSDYRRPHWVLGPRHGQKAHFSFGPTQRKPRASRRSKA
jgi:hypothetical protein